MKKLYFLNFVGMNTMEGVVVLASTNRQDILDQVRTQSQRLNEMLYNTLAIRNKNVVLSGGKHAVSKH